MLKIYYSETRHGLRLRDPIGVYISYYVGYTLAEAVARFRKRYGIKKNIKIQLVKETADGMDETRRHVTILL